MPSRRRFLRLTAAASLAGALAGCSTEPAPPRRAGPTPGRAVGLVIDPAFENHMTPAGHPERPQRLRSIAAAIDRQGLRDKTTPIAPRPADEMALERCHTRDYLALAREQIESGQMSLSTGDTAVSARSWETAVLAAGGVMAAVDAVVGGKAAAAFCAVRPPGHHAGPARGMGFCILNNVAVGVRHALATHRLERALVIDWDVHHGNGTQEIFDADPAVLFFDTHQHPWYPGTGTADQRGLGPAEGTKINVPLPAGSGRKEILAAIDGQLLPAVERFRPRIVFISAGFDSRNGDPLGRFTLVDEDFAELTRIAMQIAQRHAKGRLVSVLEGGYDLDGLASAVCAHIGALGGE